jgi:16S rRNA (cytidine1402-2'-O)-methyltransferase
MPIASAANSCWWCPAPPPREGMDVETERVLAALLAELPVKQAAKLAAEITGQPKNALYARALELKAGDL